MELALKSKAGQVLEGAQEGFLADVLGVVFRSSQMKRQAENWLVVTPHQLLESRGIPALRFPNQFNIVRT